MSLQRFSLTNKVAIVTGGGRGIGEAIAVGLADAGASVVVAARTQAQIESTATEIRKRGGQAISILTDVRESKQIENMVEKALQEFGRIDILVNNAGGGGSSAVVHKMEEKYWDDIIDGNLKSVFLCSKAVTKIMAEQKGGRIINMSSIAGLGPFPGLAHYAAAKAGVISLTRTLAVELAPYNIRVNAIAPGFIETERIMRMYIDYPRTVRKSRLAKIPLGRMGKPDDIVGVTIYLSSDAADYVTGAVFSVDGGLTTTVIYKSEETHTEWW